MDLIYFNEPGSKSSNAEEARAAWWVEKNHMWTWKLILLLTLFNNYLSRSLKGNIYFVPGEFDDIKRTGASLLRGVYLAEGKNVNCVHFCIKKMPLVNSKAIIYEPFV